MSENVKATALDIIADHTDILDHCIKEKDNRKLMVIVGKIMSRLNPNRRWDLDHKVGDPVVIKDIVLESLSKRKKSQKKSREEEDDD